MVFTQKLMVSTINAVKSTKDQCYTSSEHSADGDSAPWSACSSADMCTPMPHMTSHPINVKRYSDVSDRSLSSDTQLSTASSDAEATQPHAYKFLQPATFPTLSATRSFGSSDVMNLQDSSLNGKLADLQTWPSGQALPPAAVQLSSLYNTSNMSRAFPAYYSVKGAPVYGPGDRSRSTSHHSISSTGSWNSLSHDGSSSDNVLPTSTLPHLSHLGSNSLHGCPLADMNLFAPAHAAALKSSSYMAAQAPMEGLNIQKPPNDARSLLDSINPLPPAYSNLQTGFGAPSLMDPHTLMAYNAAFGPSSLMYLYGLTPDVLAARSAALAQLANVSPSVKPSSPPTESTVDDGVNPGNKKTNLYKTELCRSWEEKGTCRYGSKCQFAHGQEELKNVNRHPKFKTEICRTFWLHGSCPYGKRCCFLHTMSTEGGATVAVDARDSKQSNKPACNVHDPPTSRLQKRVSASPLSATSLAGKSLGIPSTSPQLHSAPATRSLSEFSHSRSNSSSSCSQSSDGSSHIESLRIQIWPRFGARDQVPPQDAPGPRSRLQRLRPSEDYADSPSSLPSTSALSATRYSPSSDCHRPPHSAISDISSILVRPSSQHISKARSANGAAEVPWPLSRLPSSNNIKA